MPLFTVNHILTTEDRLVKEFDLSHEEAVKNAYFEAFVGERPGLGRKDRLEMALNSAGVQKLDKGSMVFKALATMAMEIEHADFGLGLEISRNQFEDDEFSFATDWTAQMGSSVALHPQLLGTDAIKANGIGYDGVTFFNAAHPIDVSQGAAGGTFSNVRTTAPLTLANFVLACAQMETFKTPGGVSRNLKAKYLIVPPALRKDAFEITGAKTISATENVVASNYGIQPVVASDLSTALGGLDTTWYVSSEMPGTSNLGKPIVYSRRQDFEFTSYYGVTQSQLNEKNMVQWQVRGRAIAAYGHPFLMIRCTA